jgi:glutamyl-tRNA synthetase
MTTDIRVRMAPAPTGRLHIGTARTTLYNWLFARHHQGTFVLRIEDSDQQRSSQENMENILEALRWLEVDWDEGPGVGGPCGPYLQSQKLPRYREVAAQLVDQGIAYPCFCTPEELEHRRKEMEKQGLPPRYDRRCRALSQAERERLISEGRAHAVRFAAPDEGKVGWTDLIRGEVEFENAQLDDFVLVKADGYPTYLLAVVVDDHDMRISHVLRGEDMLPTTPRQVHIYQAMSWPLPEFAHIPIILGPDRSKMSKRHGATSVTEYRDQGYLPEAMVNFIALLGWSPGENREVMTRGEMIEAFDIEGIGSSGAVFDIEKLNWMNGLYLRQLPPEEYVARAKPFLEEAGLVGRACPRPPDDAYVTKALLLEQERAKTLGELAELVEFFFKAPDAYDEKGERKWFRREGAGKLLAAAQARLAAVEPFAVEPIEAVVRGLGAESGLGAGPVIHTIRLAVTGRTAGPGLFELLAVLGKAEALSRLRAAEEHARSLGDAA